MWKVMRLRHLVGLVLCSSVVYGMIFFQAGTGEAFEYGRSFVRHDQRIAEITGAQRSQQFEFWHGMSESYGHMDGSASFSIRVVAEHGLFTVPLALQKRQGRWRIVSASVIGQKNQAFLIVE